LVDSIATDPDFITSTTVPEGFIGTTLDLPRPAKTGFYLRLRDDPTATNTVTLPILPLVSPGPASRANSSGGERSTAATQERHEMLSKPTPEPTAPVVR
jgi:hypothetical protein